jgi:ADP-ribose pyrophosphatase
VPGRLRILSSKTIFKGKVVELKVDRVIEPTGVEAQREVVHHSGSVVILPRLSDGSIVLVRQYRYATRQRLWEAVAGGLTRGESPREGARRELLEETGYRASKLRLLFDFYSSPGFLTERMFLIEASGLIASKPRPEADERIEVGHFSPSRLSQMLRQRKIHDAKTLIAVLWILRGYPALL